MPARKTTEEILDKELPCREPIEILLANKGKTARIELHDKTLVTGTIHEVLVDKTAVPVAEAAREAAGLLAGMSPIGSAGRETPAGGCHRIPNAHRDHRRQLRACGTDDGDVLLAAGNVRTLSIKRMKTTVAKTAKTMRHSKRLSFKLPDGRKRQSLA